MYLKWLVNVHIKPLGIVNNYKLLTKQYWAVSGTFAAVRKKNKTIILEGLPITDYAAEGKALARVDGKVIFISGAVPGDVADVLLVKNKKDWAEGRVIKIKEPSKERVGPFCKHFGVCGGCKWQMLPYTKQPAGSRAKPSAYWQD